MRKCLQWDQPPQDRARAVVETPLQVPLLLKSTLVLEAVISCHHLEILTLYHRQSAIFPFCSTLQNLLAAPRRHGISTSHLGNRLLFLPWSEGLSPYQFMPVCPFSPHPQNTPYLFPFQSPAVSGTHSMGNTKPPSDPSQ